MCVCVCVWCWVDHRYPYVNICEYPYRGLEIGMLTSPYIQKVNKRTVRRTELIARWSETHRGQSEDSEKEENLPLEIGGD